MAAQSGAGMSATPQGVEAQTDLVDITTNNYQNAIEAFFSRYCSYALTIYFQELKTLEKIDPTAEARKQLIEAGVPTDAFNDKDGCVYLDFSKMAVEYFVRCVPGSLTELEDEKQLRILNQLFVPLSQAMPALAAVQDQQVLQQAMRAMTYVIGKQIELSGSASAKAILGLWQGGDIDEVNARDLKIQQLEEAIGGTTDTYAEMAEIQGAAISQMQEQIRMLTENNQLLLEKLGVVNTPSASSSVTSPPAAPEETGQRPTVVPASA